MPKKGKDGKNLLKAHPSPEKRKNKKRQTASPPGWWAKAMIRQRKNSQKRKHPETPVPEMQKRCDERSKKRPVPNLPVLGPC